VFQHRAISTDYRIQRGPPEVLEDSSTGALLARLRFLREEFRDIREGVQMAIRVAEVDPEMALTRVRKVLESVIREVYQRRVKELPGTRPLENLIQRLVSERCFPVRLDAYATAVRKLGNVGTHAFGEAITAADVSRSLSHLEPILQWYFEAERPDAISSESGVPREVVSQDKESSARSIEHPFNRDNLLHRIWDHLSPGLQDAFLLAYNKKRREGAHRISTRDLFQALTRIQDESLQSLLQDLPKDALPEPIPAGIPLDRHVLQDTPPLSDCVEDSLSHFLASEPLPRKLAPADVFVDIAKHGHGASVARLRKHGITAAEIERRVKTRGLSLLRRVD
jgi:hypothetical protein